MSTKSLLLAVAELSDRYDPSLDAKLRKFAREVISSDFDVVTAARQRFIRATNEAGSDDALQDVFGDLVFRATLECLRHNFTLYVALPVRLGRHRVLRLAFEER